jgi:hypothetical protein
MRRQGLNLQKQVHLHFILTIRRYCTEITHWKLLSAQLYKELKITYLNTRQALYKAPTSAIIISVILAPKDLIQPSITYTNYFSSH